MRRGTTRSCRASRASSSLARRHVVGLHHAVVEHHADRAARAHVRREALVQLVRRQPRDVEMHRQLRQQPERLGPVLAREQREAELHQRLARVARAAVPGRGEERVDAVAQQLAQPRLPRAMSARCSRVAARRAELALAPLDLVVGVRVAVLVQPGVASRPARPASAGVSSAGITARSSGRPCSAKRAISSSRRSSSQPASSSRKKTSTG